MSYWHGLFSIPSVLLFSFALGQSCDALLTHGLYNVSLATSDRSYKAAAYEKICSSDYSSSGASNQDQIRGSLGYAGWSIGVSSAKSRDTWQEAQAAYCEENDNDVAIDIVESQEARQIYERGIEAWERCIELQSRGVLIDFTVNESSANATTVTYGLRYTGPGASEFTGLYVSPEDAFTCEGQLGNTGTNIEVDRTTRRNLSPQALSITCERNITDQSPGTDMTIYKQATISVHTNDRNVDAFFPEIQVSSGVNLLPEVARLNNLAIDLETRLNASTTGTADLEARLATSDASRADLEAQLMVSRNQLETMQVASEIFTTGGGVPSPYIRHFGNLLTAADAAQSLRPGWTVRSIDLIYDISGGGTGSQMWKATYTLIP